MIQRYCNLVNPVSDVYVRIATIVLELLNSLMKDTLIRVAIALILLVATHKTLELKAHSDQVRADRAASAYQETLLKVTRQVAQQRVDAELAAEAADICNRYGAC